MADVPGETELPDGRVTNRQMAEYVGKKIDDARLEIRSDEEELHRTLRTWVAEYVGGRINETTDAMRTDHHALKTEMRWWLASFAAAYQFHLNLSFFGGAAVAYFGWTKLVTRLPFLNR